MASHGQRITLGLPRINNEPGEVRDFLPPFLAALGSSGAGINVEGGYGDRMGYTDADYLAASPAVSVTDRAGAFSSDIVLMLRPSDDVFDSMAAGSTLVSMLHFPTHRERALLLDRLGLEAIALDLIVDDEGTRLVENMKAVAWNGLDKGFAALERTYGAFTDHRRPPVRVTILGAGLVGKHAVEAATKYGSLERNEIFGRTSLQGVEVVTLGRGLTRDASYMKRRLARTDLLVDATGRSDASRPIVPNGLLAELPAHAVIVDLSVDPYLLDEEPPTVRGIEGIPAGDLDRCVFAPGDARWNDVPPRVPSRERRTVVSCYSWPGMLPVECMEHYGMQLAPLMETLIERGGGRHLRERGKALERALYRASLRNWIGRLRSDAERLQNARTPGPLVVVSGQPW